MTWFVKAIKGILLNILSTDATATVASFIFLKAILRSPKNIRDNCSHFCVFGFLPRENNRIADELGIDRELLERATNAKYSFLYHDRPKKNHTQKF